MKKLTRWLLVAVFFVSVGIVFCAALPSEAIETATDTKTTIAASTEIFDGLTLLSNTAYPPYKERRFTCTDAGLENDLFKAGWSKLQNIDTGAIQTASDSCLDDHTVIKNFCSKTVLGTAGSRTAACPVGTACTLGACVPQYSCTDTGTQNDSETAGSATVKNEYLGSVRVYEDVCLGAQAVIKNSCDKNNPAQVVQTPLVCADGYSCHMGACVFDGPDLSLWLTQHKNVADTIKWQFKQVNWDAYSPPTDNEKIPWSSWTKEQKKDLNHAYAEAYLWLKRGAPAVGPEAGGLSDMPDDSVNPAYNPDVVCDNCTVGSKLSVDYFWNLYVHQVGFSLAFELSGESPWSITNYNPQSLRLLFDSASAGWKYGFDPNNKANEFYFIGTYGGANLPTLRANNTPQTNYAPPRYVFTLIKQNQILDKTSSTTIVHTLDWMRGNLTHFFGFPWYANMDDVWHYRSYPPLSRIFQGTVDSNNPNYGIRHWTAGCHGSVGFLAEMLKSVNIPVEPVWVCGHELAYFPTEDLYLDHGDDPYNLNVRKSKSPSSNLLIDAATYRNWFSNDESINILDYKSPACANIGRTALEFPQ